MKIYWDYIFSDDLNDIKTHLDAGDDRQFPTWNDAYKHAVNSFAELVADGKIHQHQDDFIFFSYAYDEETDETIILDTFLDVIEYDDTDDYNEHSTFTKIGTGVK